MSWSIQQGSIRFASRASANRAGEVHAIFFVHGIFGSDETFKNDDFDWRSKIPPEIDRSRVDVFSVNYHTELVEWLNKDIASLDEVVYAFYYGLHRRIGGAQLSFLEEYPYKSIGFIGHSLGGNIATAYLHTVKTERGHAYRAQTGYIIALGAPTTGAQIADVAVWLKAKLHMPDGLLSSLTRDNTFLRMLAHWRYSEHEKAKRFECRPVNIYMAREGASMYGIPVVPPLDRADYMSSATDTETFANVNHEMLAKPVNERDPIYRWVDKILLEEITRINKWQPKPQGVLVLDEDPVSKLCSRQF